MKFSALVVALATLADAKKPSSFAKNTIQKKLNNVDQRSFLKRARKLEEMEGEAENQYYNYDAGFQIDGSYSVQFSQCVSYSEDYDGDDGAYADAESVHVQDYIVVNLVDSSGNVGGVYAMDVGEFVGDMGSLVYEQHSSYCEACEQMNCANDEQYENEWNVDYEWNEEDGEYDAVQTQAPKSYAKGSGYEVVDCDVCATHCGMDNEYQDNYYDAAAEGDYEYEGENGCRRRAEEEIEEEEAWNFIKEIGECQQFKSENQYYSDNNKDDEDYNGDLYFGWKCNEEGDGIDLAFFYDGDCSLLDVSGKHGVSNEIHEGSEAYAAITHMKSLVKGIFTQSISCEDVTFVTGYEDEAEEEEEGEEEEQANNYNNGVAVNEYCSALVDAGMDINQCDDDACTVITAKLGQDNENYFEENEDAEFDADEMDEDGDIFEFKETYNWAADEDGEYVDCGDDADANVYDYTAWVQRKDNKNGSIFSGMMGPEGVSAWAVAGILASVAAIGAIAFVVLKKPTVENESLGEYMLEEPKPVDEKIV